MPRLKPIATVLALVLTACNGHTDATSAPAASAETAAPPATAPATPPATPSPTQGQAPMQDISRFIPAGMTAVETVRGDLTGDGHSDALLVLSPPESDEAKLGEGAPRTVLLLTQDASGALHKAADNARIVPCARCGGLAGDPYAFSRIEAGRFTISLSGGSRERWADDYTFRYAPEQKTWQLDKVVRELTDTQSGQHTALELTGKEFGQVAFADFDPATLAKPAPLPEQEGADPH